MKLRTPYEKCEAKKYTDLESFFSNRIDFTRKSIPKTIKEMDISSRVWLLFARNNNNEDWKCLQVAQSKNDVKEEIKDVLSFLHSSAYKENNSFKNSAPKNSAFYENVCPNTTNGAYREVLYSKIGSEYKFFQICFLDVDKFLGIKADTVPKGTDIERIIEICKNQYAEAIIAYQTLAVYWRLYSSGIDGQTIAYIVEHPSEFEN